MGRGSELDDAAEDLAAFHAVEGLLDIVEADPFGDELVQRQSDIAADLALPPCTTPVNIYLFDDEAAFTRYMRQRHPLLPDRRAFFVRNDTDLMVFAWWGERVAEDLRHEVTHGYLHSQLPDLPLWLDEGLAEYYETPPANDGYSSPHAHLLLDQLDRAQWQPDLKRLESITKASSLTLMDYAESWLWVHWLLHDARGRSRLQQHVSEQLANDGVLPISASVGDDAEAALSQHLTSLRVRSGGIAHD